MPLCRASELDRIFQCAGSLVLPQEPKEIGVAGHWGNAVHSWMETGELPGGRDGKALQQRIEKGQVVREKWWPLTGEFEVTLALNVVTGAVKRYVPTGDINIEAQRKAKTAWKLAFDDEWVVGSADYVGELLDTPWVDDLKTGRYAYWQSHAAQQTFYSLAYSLHKYMEIRDVRSTITHWTRYPIGGVPSRKGVLLETPYLSEFYQKLKKLRKDYKEGKIELNAGNHCIWCPSQKNCLAYKDMYGKD